MRKIEIMHSKLVSIVIPCYNAERFIENTLKTVLNQTYRNFEVIVVDDGSSDRSAEIVNRIAQNDKRVIYFYQPNAGVSAARNNGIKLAKGNYIAVLDSDDFWMNDNLEKKIHILESEQIINWVYCDIDLVDIDGKIVDTLLGNDVDIVNNLLILEEHVVPGICSNIICRSLCFQEGNLSFDAQLSTSADRDFAIQLAVKHKGKRIKEVLVQCLKYGGNMSENIKLYEKDMTYLLEKNVKQKLYTSDRIYRLSFSNFFQSMFLGYRKTDKKKSFSYLLKMLKIRPTSLFYLAIKALKS